MNDPSRARRARGGRAAAVGCAAVAAMAGVTLAGCADDAVHVELPH